MFDLTGKAALVIGGSRGIGAASAESLARQGADVAITFGRSEDRARDVVGRIESRGRKAVAFRSDAARRGAAAETVREAVRALGHLDILVVTAGTFDVGDLAALDDDRYDHSMDLHVRATFEAVREATNHLQEGGRIVTFGSVLGEEAPFPGLALYTASKAAVAGLTKAAARDLGPRGITANTVQPGPIDTEMNPAGEANPASDYQRSQTALGRYGKAEEVAALVVYLASPEAAFVTGQAINIDGGWTA